MRSPIIVLLIIFWASLAQARDFGWVNYQQPFTNDANIGMQSAMALDSLGQPAHSYYWGNVVYGGGLQLGDYRIDHLHSDGSLLWRGSLHNVSRIESIIFDPDDAMIIYGAYGDTLQVGDDHFLSHPTEPRPDFLLKLNADHQVEWLIDPNISNPGFTDLNAMAVDAGGNIWIAGLQGHTETSILKLNPDGSTATTYPQLGVEFISGLAVDPDGTVWVSGAMFMGDKSFNGYEVYAPFIYTLYLAKYAPDGQAQWVRFVEDISFPDTELASDGQGNVYFAGPLWSNIPFGDLIPEGPEWVYDFFLTKVNADGDFLWLREVPADDLPGDAGLGETTFLCCPNPDSVYLAGFSRQDVDWAGDGNPPTSYGSQDVLVLEYSSDGEFIMAKTAGSSWNDKADAVDVDASGNVYLAGMVYTDAQFDDQHLNNSSAGSFITVLPLETSAVPQEQPSIVGSLQNHPNPFNPMTRITYSLAAPTSVNLRIFDVHGSFVATLDVGQRDSGEHHVQWDGRDHSGRLLSSGQYFCHLKTEMGVQTLPMVMIR